MTITAHNRIHAHSPWNKGIKADTNKKWADTHKKAQAHRWQTFLPLFAKTYQLKQEGKSAREIAIIQGITSRQVYDRLKKIKYLRPIQQWNKGKKEEYKDRINYKNENTK